VSEHSRLYPGAAFSVYTPAEHTSRSGTCLPLTTAWASATATATNGGSRRADIAGSSDRRATSMRTPVPLTSAQATSPRTSVGARDTTMIAAQRTSQRPTNTCTHTCLALRTHVFPGRRHTRPPGPGARGSRRTSLGPRAPARTAAACTTARASRPPPTPGRPRWPGSTSRTSGPRGGHRPCRVPRKNGRAARRPAA
jgi:hypothetical protein